MPSSLKRYQLTGDLHFITFSCYERRSHLSTTESKNLFLETLLHTCSKYKSVLDGFVIMPEHVHLLLHEPSESPLATMMQALKCSVAKRSVPRPFWYSRYYDFNIYTDSRRTEKLTYMALNPVKRGLCISPQDWPWSSAFIRQKASVEDGGE